MTAAAFLAACGPEDRSSGGTELEPVEVEPPGGGYALRVWQLPKLAPPARLGHRLAFAADGRSGIIDVELPESEWATRPLAHFTVDEGSSTATVLPLGRDVSACGGGADDRVVDFGFSGRGPLWIAWATRRAAGCVMFPDGTSVALQTGRPTHISAAFDHDVVTWFQRAAEASELVARTKDGFRTLASVAPSKSPVALSTSPDGAVVAFIVRDNSAPRSGVFEFRALDPSGTPVAGPFSISAASVGGLSVAPGGRSFAAAVGAEGEVSRGRQTLLRVWHVSGEGMVEGTPVVVDGPRMVRESTGDPPAWTPDGDFIIAPLALQGSERAVCAVSPQSGEILRCLPSTSGVLNAMAVRRDGSRTLAFYARTAQGDGHGDGAVRGIERADISDWIRRPQIEMPPLQ